MKNNTYLPKIIINNQNNYNVPFNLYNYIHMTCQLLSLSVEHLEITFLSVENIQKMNNEHFSTDSPTDTISFNLSTADNLLGDIYICPTVIKKNASTYDETYEKEFKIVIIHSILHLVGYTDSDSNSRDEMIVKQNKIYKQLLTNEL